MKANKRILHFRSTKFPARTLQEDLPDSMNAEDFVLQDHVNALVNGSVEVDQYTL